MISSRNLFCVFSLSAILLAAACNDPVGPGEQCELGCIEGSGYPCPCYPEEGCDGDAVCGAISQVHNVGFCSLPCEKHSDCEIDLDCNAESKCVMQHEETGDMYCGYVCNYDEDCPINMDCVTVYDTTVCYPRL